MSTHLVTPLRSTRRSVRLRNFSRRIWGRRCCALRLPEAWTMARSTLIGRLLHDTKSVYEDQLAAVKKSRVNRAANGHVDFSLLTDGLKAEREQGITIDVAYRYFSTSRRKFIIADTPGHEQYTRNMATGASTADVAIMLIDAKAYCEGGRAAAAVASAYVYCVAAGDSACRGCGEQDGPGGLFGGEL